ncbi:DNA polymerase delta catalytic subunit [Brazilian marseillevirus]|uniref:DNA polymerase delta catalytic subunit n=1 Tax=Brazilian marseillevirus TaxID=1813599 RepID=UPI000783C1F2|nr:DNA polymerase delta catalytic subunit [Brazilian marseillevirus]AMQ10896.1 DNA polymerase delta catalytic subunit [Brazilian marseillevirus]
MAQRTHNFKISKWDFCDSEEGLVFYAYGRDELSQTVCAKIEGFHPYVYIQLPKKRNLKWGKREARILFEHLKTKVCKKYPPVSFELKKKSFLKGRVPVQTLRLEFLNIAGAKMCANAMENRENRVEGLGVFAAKELRSHEQNIDVYTKFFTHRVLDSTGWIKVVEEKGLAYEKNSKADKEYVCDWRNVSKGEDMGLINTKKLSFDIEAYSAHHSAFPDPNIKENAITQIAYTVEETNGGIWKEVISLGNCLRIRGAKVLNARTEKELLLLFFRRVSDIDPDLVIGYNIIKFDWNYLMTRAKRHGIFQRMCELLTRIFAVPASEDKMSWSSSAYGTQKFVFTKIPGVSQIDMYVEFERNHKLDKNTLDHVSELFLGEKKKDVTAKELFKIMETSMILESFQKTSVPFRERRRAVYTAINRKHSTSYLLDFRQRVKRCRSLLELDLLVRSGVTKLADYCIQDTVLPLRLLKHFDVELNMDMLAGVFCVPREYLQTRGQQVKVFSMLYREMQSEDLIVEFLGYDKEVSNVKYKGATVFDAKTGFWEDVLVWDFESLYPSEIISRNIDYTSFCTNDESVPDEECNIVEWDQHEFCKCPLDSKAGKNKKKDQEVVCGHFKQRFKKSKVLENGEIQEGVLPRMLRHVLARRKAVKGEMGQAARNADKEVDPEKKAQFKTKEKVANASQLALKIAANSAYGALGATQGISPLVEAAAAVTTAGRQDIVKVVDRILERWPEGILVYGDTDSCMIHFPGGRTPKDLIEFGVFVGKEISKHLVSPMNLQFEKLCKKFIIFSKKRYYTFIVDENGKVIAIDKKGIVLTRRDNCLLVRDLFGATVKQVIEKEDTQKILQGVYDGIYGMMSRSIPDQKYVITASIKALDEYKNDGKGLVNVALARKMKKRGEEVIPNTRLEFVFLTVPDKKKGEKTLQAEQVEDFTWYIDNKKRLGLKIDTHLYLTKKVMEPLAELLNIWEKKTIEYEKLDERIKRLKSLMSPEDKDCVTKLEFLFRKTKLSDSIPEKSQSTIDSFFGKRESKREPQSLLHRARVIANQALASDKKVVSLLIESYNREKHIKTLNARRKMFGLQAVRQRLPKRGAKILVQDEKILKTLAKAHLAHSETALQLKRLFARPIVVE